ncbi:MAG: ATP synthase F1 subunit epsilon [Muribaculaceae bacterium]|nr:ATP synthase F1 subunit epsilon [Muribaculaceae bacterium]
MTLKIISANEVVYEGTAKSVTLPGTMGQFTVLNHHAALVSTLTAGKITFTTEDDKLNSYTISGGVVDVDNNVVSVCLY